MAKAKKKSFKSLPRKAQKAAFAQMSDDGTLKKGKKSAASGGSVKASAKKYTKGLASTSNSGKTSGFRFSEGPNGAARVESPKNDQLAITPRNGRTNRRIVSDLKKNKNFR